ncbi:MAG: 16S rRNA (uracil(1498)-N(3))-methyltransferase [Alphaproteobacteria bacterium]|nr:16S rRNA (uracil(1498)-N(3))-methyltransferase [Alphaproteobacteria bacterium]
MKNIPRIFVGDTLYAGIAIPVGREVSHYLQRVMRRNDCLAFGGGVEYRAELSPDGKLLLIGDKTDHLDPSNNVTLMFSPIKRMDDMLNMATQMGVSAFQPVIMDRTVAHHINWQRMEKIITEASEQSNRNSVPKILPPIKFSDLDLSHIVFADERVAYGKATTKIPSDTTSVLIGPEGGFSDAELSALDGAGAIGIGLGKTILRAEVASIVALARIINNMGD